MAGVEGIEPSHDGVKVRCLTAWRHPNARSCVIGNKWGERGESNPRVPEPQSGALTTSPHPPHWQGQQDLNPRHSVLETDVLPTELCPYVWCRQQESNPRPTDYKSVALPTELHRHVCDARFNITHWSRSCQPFCFVRPNEMYLITDPLRESILFFKQKTCRRPEELPWRRSGSFLQAIFSRSSCRTSLPRIS